jgi:hypothetical protein
VPERLISELIRNLSSRECLIHDRRRLILGKGKLAAAFEVFTAVNIHAEVF